MNELALFAGAGGGILGGTLLGWRTVCAVEFDAYARSVLLARQRDGCLCKFPIWDDVRTFDGHPWRGHVDVVSGGFPCQDISAAGKGAGITGERSGLWKHMARIVREVRPEYVFVENSPMLTRRGLGVVLGDLSEMGYNARWCVLGACDSGAPHKRERIWILANAQDDGFGRREQQPQIGEGARHVADYPRSGRRARRPWGFDTSSSRESELTLSDVANSSFQRRPEARRVRHDESTEWTGGSSEDVADAMCVRSASGIPEQEQGEARFSGELVDGGAGRPVRQGWWESEPDVGRVAHGVASRVDRLRCIGNGQVPAVVKLAWDTLNLVP